MATCHGNVAGCRSALGADGRQSLGLVESFYPPSVLAARRQEARKLGFAPNERGTLALVVQLDELLSSYVSVVADAA